MSIKHALLGLLADGPLHGYELKAAYETELAPRSALNYGQVYPTLDRLERDDLVAHQVVTQADRPDKKVFALTRKGREELRRWLTEPGPPEAAHRNETYMKLVLAERTRTLPPRAVVAAERRAGLARLHELTRTRARLAREPGSRRAALLLELAALRQEAFLKWLDRCEETFAKEET